ncbi:4Fe-4S cluster-binding domain-containing protein [Methanoculleus sp. YWC-01]|jgi:putative pyruvate formate lyase activating enzyme|uniref:4Fe-4S cluster-binding domain-containing protein n=1 Tax=Methanoculleus nereidis TaxID=2735141 RepID=A0ABU3Z3T8_9EURY|nr:radical SAM protein [Methanoculleus sp. YWC-01]MCK9298006.1 4Fe-4S cluster-binding domain-containing protein [Methanoculleus sp.]MDV4343229.1 4Fe-4S cluster-binding domain-containing protein [Methanoculleus sp. YWC-01]PKL56575.1 MAG: radical SAM protein [Methanomicrobiales archaeon HGW-Methanomicrobiales-6]
MAEAERTQLPGYVRLSGSGELEERARRAHEVLRDCVVCPQECRVNRIEDELGFCRTGLLPRVSSYSPHFGEETPLVGKNGSGTIFFAGCNMRCEFCQNYEISQCGAGYAVSNEDLAAIMLHLQERRCHNINLVSPSHVVPQILGAVALAAPRGLNVPLVYNSGGYDSVETLRLLDGVIDIYMPDAKYGRDDVALELSHAPGYTARMQAALKEMHRQVGDLVIRDGLAVRGMIIRHLVLPGNLASSEIVLKFIAEELSRDSYVNIMAQYHPAWKAAEGGRGPVLAALQRPITSREYQYAIRCARENSLSRGFP